MNADRNTAIALAAALTVWFFGSLIAAKGIFSQETAAWVQAIGAVGAIVAAGWAAQLPLKQEIKRRRDAEDHLLRSIEVAGWLIAHDLAPIRGAVAAGQNERFQDALDDTKGNGHTTMERYLSLPITAWPSIEVYVSARDLWQKGDAYIEMATGIRHHLGGPAFQNLRHVDSAFEDALGRFFKAIHFERHF